MQLGEVYYHQGAEEIWDKEKQKDWLLNLMNNQSILIAPRITNDIRAYLRNELILGGWSNETNLSIDTDLTISAKKDRFAIQIQTGNICRAPYDFLKLQYLYLEGDIQASALIVPSKQAAKKIGSNIAHFERLKKELQLFKKIITVPMVLISFD